MSCRKRSCRRKPGAVSVVARRFDAFGQAQGEETAEWENVQRPNPENGWRPVTQTILPAAFNTCRQDCLHYSNAIAPCETRSSCQYQGANSAHTGAWSDGSLALRISRSTPDPVHFFASSFPAKTASILSPR